MVVRVRDCLCLNRVFWKQKRLKDHYQAVRTSDYTYEDVSVLDKLGSLACWGCVSADAPHPHARECGKQKKNIDVSTRLLPTRAHARTCCSGWVPGGGATRPAVTNTAAGEQRLPEPAPRRGSRAPAPARAAGPACSRGRARTRGLVASAARVRRAGILLSSDPRACGHSFERQMRSQSPMPIVCGR